MDSKNLESAKQTCNGCGGENVIVEAHPQLEDHKVRRCLNPYCKRWDAIFPEVATA